MSRLNELCLFQIFFSFSFEFCFFSQLLQAFVTVIDAGASDGATLGDVVNNIKLSLSNLTKSVKDLCNNLLKDLQELLDSVNSLLSEISCLLTIITALQALTTPNANVLCNVLKLVANVCLTLTELLLCIVAVVMEALCVAKKTNLCKQVQAVLHFVTQIVGKILDAVNKLVTALGLSSLLSNPAGIVSSRAKYAVQNNHSVKTTNYFLYFADNRIDQLNTQRN